MSADELPDSLLDFIRACIPTYQAAELLLFFAANREDIFTPEEVVLAMRPVTITVSAVRDYAALFVRNGLIAEKDGRFRYRSSSEAEHGVEALVQAYTQKPVSLIRAIYGIAENQITS
jgi:hypothetical protein